MKKYVIVYSDDLCITLKIVDSPIPSYKNLQLASNKEFNTRKEAHIRAKYLSEQFGKSYVPDGNLEELL